MVDGLDGGGDEPRRADEGTDAELNRDDEHVQMVTAPLLNRDTPSARITIEPEGSGTPFPCREASFLCEKKRKGDGGALKGPLS